MKKENLNSAAKSILVPPGEMIRTLRDLKGQSQLKLQDSFSEKS